jgi:hypothetical protein
MSKPGHALPWRRDTLRESSGGCVADINVREARRPRIVQQSRVRRPLAESQYARAIDDDSIRTRKLAEQAGDFGAMYRFESGAVGKVGDSTAMPNQHKPRAIERRAQPTGIDNVDIRRNDLQPVARGVVRVVAWSGNSSTGIGNRCSYIHLDSSSAFGR